MDLRAFGINKTIRNQDDLEITREELQIVRFDRRNFVFPSDDYIPRRVLGQGTYGKIYLVESARTDARYAIKVQQIEDDDNFQDTIREAIMNIILEQASSTQADGPYVQRFFEIGRTADSKAVIMRIGLLSGTLWDLVGSSTPEQNDSLVPTALLQISKMVKFFGDRLQMNHRDMKSDNIMYELIDGKPVMRIIDLGMSCLTYNHVHYSMQGMFREDPKACGRKGRDLSFLIFELLLDLSDSMSPRLRKALEQMITFSVGGVECKMYEMCPALGLGKWENSYNFLNRANVENPKATPDAVTASMRRFLPPAAGGSRRKTYRRRRASKKGTRRH